MATRNNNRHKRRKPRAHCKASPPLPTLDLRRIRTDLRLIVSAMMTVISALTHQNCNLDADFAQVLRRFALAPLENILIDDFRLEDDEVEA